MKTVEQWLNALDEPYKTQALLNAEKDEFWEDYKKIVVNNIGSAISMAFVWAKTEQCAQYWADVAQGGNP